MQVKFFLTAVRFKNYFLKTGQVKSVACQTAIVASRSAIAAFRAAIVLRKSAIVTKKEGTAAFFAGTVQ